MDNEFLEFIKSYETELNKYNKIHNITRLKDIKAAALDSIKVLDFVKIHKINSVADIGSGAGFPAIFLAFLKHECEFYLYEPNYKKAAFLSMIKVNFNLDNVFVKPMKVECEKDLKVDLITSRAFAKTELVVKLCDNISKDDTKFILYKGSFVNTELDCLKAYEIYECENRKYLEFYKKDFKNVTN